MLIVPQDVRVAGWSVSLAYLTLTAELLHVLQAILQMRWSERLTIDNVEATTGNDAVLLSFSL